MDDDQFGLEEQFVQSLSPFERTALEIARTQLGSSFSLHKCNGFVEFVKEKKNCHKKLKTDHPEHVPEECPP